MWWETGGFTTSTSSGKPKVWQYEVEHIFPCCHVLTVSCNHNLKINFRGIIIFHLVLFVSRRGATGGAGGNCPHMIFDFITIFFFFKSFGL